MANENKTAKEYVQKGYLIAHLANCGIRTINYDEWERLCECIHEAKTADVVEVVHGYNISKGGFLCNVCKFGDFNGFHGYEPNFCPNCGADMRGGTDD